MIKTKALRLLVLALVSSSMLVLSACADEDSSKSSQTETTSAQTTDAAVKANKEDSYTQTYVGEAQLVPVDGYTVGARVQDGIIHYIFQVEKDGEKSVDTDVAETYCKVIDVNSDEAYKDKLDKVFAYERTYEDGAKHFYYEIYTIDASIANLGELSSVQDDNE